MIIDSSTAELPSMISAVDRHLLAGAYEDDVADQHFSTGNIELLTVAQDARRLGLQAQQFLDCLTGAAFGAQFQRLA